MRAVKQGLVAFLAGAASFAILHLFLVGTWKLGWEIGAHGVRQAWFLNSIPAMIVTLSGLFLAGFMLGFATASLSEPWSTTAYWMAPGVAVSLTAVLMIIGPGTVWPIVVFVGILLATPAVAGGVRAGIAWAQRR
jgi:hypothetical protein